METFAPWALVLAAGEGSRLREDVPGKPMPRKDLLSNAPDVDEEQFRVPPVLD